MPKIKQLEKCKHPNSRKTKALAKQMKKQSLREKTKISGNIKLKILATKIYWFKDKIDKNQKNCSPQDVANLIVHYLDRFNEELKKIDETYEIGFRSHYKQHAKRESIIKMTMQREIEEFNTCGVEIPNLLDPVQYELLKNWNGDVKYVQNFKMRRFSKSFLQDKIKIQNK